MSDINKQCDKVYLNVASSTCMLEGFVNLDNHVLLPLLKLPRMLRKLIPDKYRSMLDSYDVLVGKHVFIRHDCRKPLPFGDGAVDHILCSHFLEHVYSDEADEILLDFRRVLKPGGTMHIVLPDILGMAKKYIDSAGTENPTSADEFIKETLLRRQGQSSLRYRLLEFVGGYGLDHKWMYDKFSINNRVTKHGFAVTEQNDTPSKSYRYGDGSVHLVAKKC